MALTVSADTVHHPVGCLQIRRLGSPDHNVLHVPPSEISVCFQREGTNAGRQRRRGWGTGVAAGAIMMQIRSDDLLLTGGAWTVGGSERGRARLAIPGHETVLGRATDWQRPNAVGITIAVAIVVVSAAVSRRPYEDRAFAVATLANRGSTSSKFAQQQLRLLHLILSIGFDSIYTKRYLKRCFYGNVWTEAVAMRSSKFKSAEFKQWDLTDAIECFKLKRTWNLSF